MHGYQYFYTKNYMIYIFSSPKMLILKMTIIILKQITNYLYIYISVYFA